MKFVKQTLLALSFSIITLPVLSAVDAATFAERNSFNAKKATAALEHISLERVQKTKQDITNEAGWAKPTRYAIIGVTLAAAGYGIYKWYSAPKVTEPTQMSGNLSEEGYKFFKDLSATDKKTIATNINDSANVLHKALKGAAEAEYANQSWLRTIGNNMQSVGGLLALQFGVQLAAAGIGYGINTIAPYVPATGTLHWYLAARTDYDRNLNDVMRYLSFYELFENEITEVVRLITFDIEKALGYLGYFEQLLVEQKSPAHILTASARYRANIELLANNLVDTLNSSSPITDVVAKLRLLDAEVRSAKGFVSANYN